MRHVAPLLIVLLLTSSCGGQGDGDGSSTECTPPSDEPLTGVTQLVGDGDIGCAILEGGAVQCWGEDDLGRTCHKDGTFEQLSWGLTAVCGIREDSSIACWGYGSDPDEEEPYIGMFNPRDEDQAVPPEGTGFSRVSIGSSAACAIREAEGAMTCWGDPNSLLVDAEDSLDGVLQIEFLLNNACIVSEAGLVSDSLCGKYLDIPSDTSDVIEVAVTGPELCALSEDGTVNCYNGEDFESSPGMGEPDTNGVFASIDMGKDHICGLTNSGEASCWGRGDTPETDPASDQFAQAVEPDGAFEFVWADGNISCGGRPSGQLVCWGDQSVVEDIPGAEFYAP